MRNLLTLFVTSCFLLLTAQASAGTGDLDPTFGTAGIARLSYAEGRAVNVMGSVKLHDGRIAVVGDMASPVDGLQHVVFSRLNSDGTFDATFGDAGWVTMPAPMTDGWPSTNLSCTATGIARGGSSIVALASCGGRIGLFSITPDGTPTSGFGPWGAGWRIDDAGVLTARAVAVDSQGRIIIGGSRRQTPTGTSNAFMRRFLPNGTPDASFGNQFSTPGLSTQSLAVGDDELLALAVDATDRIVGVGYGTASLGAPRVMIATRFQANGQVGPFGMTNNAWVSYTGEGDTARAVAIENSGTIVVAGTASYTHWNGQSSSKFYIWRIADTGYTTAEGAQAIDIPMDVANDANASASALHITQDGWIVMVAGTVSNATGTRTAYACIYPDNRIATYCGQGGRYFGPPPADGGSVLGLYVTSNFKFLSVGRKGDAVAVARFSDYEGTIDTAYGTNGAGIYAPWAASQVAVNGLAVQPDGKLIVAATSQAGAARVGRLTASGQPDTTFGTGGYYDLGIEGNTRSLAAQAAAVQADGKILVALRSAVLEGFNAGQAIVLVIRLNADGTRDATWISYVVDGKPAAIAIKGDGRVVLLTAVTAPERMALTQFATDGSIQASATLLGTGAEAHVPAALALDANGNALAAGYTRMSSTLGMVVYRYTDMLQPDAGWGGGAFSIVDFGMSSAARGIAIGADGKVVLAGACGNTVAHPCFARLESNGQLDWGFGVNGRVVHTLTPSGERAVSAHVTAEGKTFAAIDHLGGLGIALVRADGTLDPAVSGTGSNLPVTNGDAVTSVMQADGRVVVAGSDSSPEGAAWILARFEPDVVVPPDTVIDYFSPQQSPTPVRDAMFAFQSSKPWSTFECSLDGSDFTPCTVPVSFTNLSEGTHTFRVRAIDAAGVKDPTPAERAWIVDLPPTVEITGGPTAPTNAMPITFTFLSNDPAATFYCRFESPMGPMWQGPCQTPYLWGGSDGTYTLYVRAMDAGNQSSPEVSRTFTIDTQPPMAMITSKPENPSTSSTATFVFSANESAATFECLNEGMDFAPCASPFTRTGLPPGSHVFALRAKDLAGNVSQVVVYQWTTSLAPPETTITSGPTGVSSAPAVFTFTASASPASFECRVDNSSYFACASPFNLGTPPPGPRTFEVRAIANGMPDPTPATASWTQAAAGAPDTTITSGPSGVSTGIAAFTFTSSVSPATFECRVDGGSPFPCSSPITLGMPPLGPRTFEVRAIASGMPDPTPAISSWNQVQPAVPNTSVSPSAPPAASSLTFTFTSSLPGSTFECRLDGGGYAPCASPYTVTGPLGVHVLFVRARFGNDVDPTPSQVTFSLQAGPETTITQMPAAVTTSTTATFRYSASPSAAGYECKMDGEPFVGCSPSGTTYGGLTHTTHTFQVRARNSSGVFDATPATYTWRIQ
ncbi:hypothetical protein DSM104443_01230 [Usitatibacter rugosus]|uniref:Delta-60 repeat domain-containing protein n=1 Tax=Usitatibacter rugosus TaxID=2732067 RepID=A0A6M4GSU3_9PROT|nr:hypothetical protein [Usitatibacter rugosus]QJR10176.1 hypothetical protein DSM104443_01230 [Usitatibacter rugosus]